MLLALYSRSQKGQAMVLGLIFLGMSLMFMLLVYNQGQLVRHRVALENAADATVYSLAKLGARHHNFTAYTNRAMVANEVSIGQLNALVSWARHYKNVDKFLTFPAYKTPILPFPGAPTWELVLKVLTIPYKIGGTAAEAAAKQLIKYAPPGVTNVNKAIAFAQKYFFHVTAAAQIQAHFEVVAGNQLGDDESDIYPSLLSFAFLANNLFQTNWGDKYGERVTDAIDSVVGSMGAKDDEFANMLHDYLPGASMTINNQAKPTGDDDGDEAVVAAYQRYAAIVNENRDPFTADRHWDFGLRIPDFIPAVTIPLPIPFFLMTKIDVDFSIWVGVMNDGGTVYRTPGDFDKISDIEKLSWESLDTWSIGVIMDFGLYMAWVRCSIWTGKCKEDKFLDESGRLMIGFPLGAATHQARPLNLAKKWLADWGGVNIPDGDYGGDPENDMNDGAQSDFHFNTLTWGAVSGMYGGPQNISTKVTKPPGFISLGEHFQEKGSGYEYTVALAIDLDDVETSDQGPFNIGQSGSTSGEDWLEGQEKNIAYTRFELDTCARAEGNGAEGLYQRLAYHDSTPMTTISSAEVYHSNSLQVENGLREYANFFSPFWDARLIQPSGVAHMIATGKVPWKILFGPDAPDDAVGLVGWMLKEYTDKIIDDQVASIVDSVEWPFKRPAEQMLDPMADGVKDVNSDIVSAVTGGMNTGLGALRFEDPCDS